MIRSKRYEAEYDGERCDLYVMRSDGSCWGRLVLEDGWNYDVDPGWYDEPEIPIDPYCWDDDDAAELFRRNAALHLGTISEAQGWIIEREGA